MLPSAWVQQSLSVCVLEAEDAAANTEAPARGKLVLQLGKDKQWAT